MFLRAMRNNILLALVLPIMTIVLSLALAALVTVGGRMRRPAKGLKGSGFYRGSPSSRTSCRPS